MKSLVTALFFVILIPTFAWAKQECIVISGMKRDWNNAFADFQKMANSADGLKVGENSKNKCIIVPSWADADAKVQELTKNDKSVFIMQLAHGERGGMAQCDAGDEGPQTILKYLNSWSQTKKVGTLITSCYSGSLIKDKLIEDAADPKNPGIANLCLITASAINRPGATGIGLSSQISSMINLNLYDSYLRYKGYSQDLSLAGPWDSSGLTNYLKDKKLKDAASFLGSLNESIENTLNCPKISPFMQTCLKNENINTAFHQKFKHYLDINDGSDFPKLAKDIDIELTNFDLMTKLLKTLGRSIKHRVEEKECLQQKAKWITFISSKSNLGALLNPDRIVQTKLILKKCHDYYLKNPGPIYKGDPTPTRTFFFSPEIDKTIMGRELYSKVIEMEDIKKVVDPVLSGLHPTDYRFGSTADEYSKILQALPSGACDPASSSLSIILGEDYVGRNNPRDENFDPRDAMHELNMLMLRTMPVTSEVDKKRTQACKDFTIGEN